MIMKLIVSLIVLFGGCALAYRGDKFPKDFYKSVVVDKTAENVVFSPVSVSTSVALLFFGAGGVTEKEIRHSIGFPTETKNEVVKSVGEFIEKHFKVIPDGPELTLANKFYVNEGVHVKPEFAHVAEKYFGAAPETVKFAESSKTVAHINSWVQSQTHDKIKDLLDPTSVDADTTSVFVNAIYFKGSWEEPFLEHATKKADFFVTATQKVPVDFMSNSEYFKYGEFPQYDAKAVVLPYKNSDLSMLIILPNKVDGLHALEEKLSFADFKSSAMKMVNQKVDVVIPKFKIEFDIDLKEPFRKMGMTTFFTDGADFNGVFTVPTKVSDGVHKAFISVDEHGSEAAAATYFKAVATSLIMDEVHQEFRADHPFVFAIFNENMVYFAGHVAKF